MAPFLSSFTFANGGNIRIAEGKYLVNISSSPVTPIVSQKTAMLISFADVATNTPFTQALRAWIEIKKKGSQEVVFPKTEYAVEGGIFEFAFTYPGSGLYELFVQFERSDEPGKIYESEDFLVDVQPTKKYGETQLSRFLLPFLTLISGALIGLSLGRRRR